MTTDVHPTPPTPLASATWQRDIVVQVRARNATQTSNFAELVHTAARLQRQVAALNERNAALEKDVRQYKSADFRAQQEAASSSASSSSSSASSSLSAAAAARSSSDGSGGMGGSSLETMKRLTALEEELRDSYRKSAVAAQHIVELTNAEKETAERVRRTEAELDEWRTKYSLLETLAETRAKELAERDKTIATLSVELHAHKQLVEEHTQRRRELERENEAMIQQVMKMKADQIAKMNEINEMYETVQLQARQAKLVAGAEKTIAAATERAGGGAGGAGGAGELNDLRADGIDLSVQLPKKMKRCFEAHPKAEVNALAFNTLGTLFATGASDKAVRLWDARSGNAKNTLHGSVQSVMSVDFSSNDEFLLAGSNDNSARVWHVDQGRIRHTLTGHVGKVLSAKFSSDFQRVVSGSHDRTLKIWDLSKGYCIRTLLCVSSCNSVAVTVDGSMVVSGHFDGSVRVWDMKNGDAIREVTGVHQKAVSCVAFSPDQQSVMCVSRDNVVTTLDVHKWQPTKTYRDERFFVGVNWAGGCFSPDGRYVCAPSSDNSAYVWNVASGALEKSLPSQNRTAVATCAAWSRDGAKFAFCDKSGFVSMWE